MVQLKRNRRQRATWGPGHIAQLMFGSDFFGEAWGTTRWGIEHGKVSAEIIEDMRRAWGELRSQVMVEWGKRERIHDRPWAARYFDGNEGATIDEPEPAELVGV